MKPTHRIIVSTENNAYSGWQCKLFYFSAVTRLKHQPTFIVHDSGMDWQRDFHDLVRAGATVLAAPSYAQGPRDSYKPRNTAGTLIHAAEICADDELIVLCDPDMIFLGEPRFPEVLSGNFYSYVDYDDPEVLAAAQNLGLPRSRIEKQKEELRCGVPYVIPSEIAQTLGKAWLEAVDAFSKRSWIDIMYAFGFAAVKLGLTVKRTNIVDVNLRQDARVTKKIIHYCYGDELWEKRSFMDEQASEVWHPEVSARKGTILGELVTQLHEARDFYSNAYF